MLYVHIIHYSRIYFLCILHAYYILYMHVICKYMHYTYMLYVHIIHSNRIYFLYMLYTYYICILYTDIGTIYTCYKCIVYTMIVCISGIHYITCHMCI